MTLPLQTPVTGSALHTGGLKGDPAVDARLRGRLILGVAAQTVPEQAIADWVSAVRKLWQDEKHYAELSAAALAHSQRREASLDHQMNQWEQAMMTVRGHTTPAITATPHASG